MAQVDERVLLWINSLVGKSPILDRIMILLANDYFIPVSFLLILVGLWFLGGDMAQRENYQRAVMCASASAGIACGFVLAFSQFNWHQHPFNAMELQDTTARIYYEIKDPPFPSNTSAVTFAVATGIWLRSHKIGWFLFIPAFLMPFAKVYAAVYYPTDILAGAALGILTTYFVYKIVFRVGEPIASLSLKVLRKLCLA